MEIEILYQDKETLVINKPVGLVVNRAESVSAPTVQDWIEDTRGKELFQYKDKEFLQRSGFCHRLDKETSGCLIIAKDPEAMKYYLKMFKDRSLKKEYAALVHGRVEPDEGTIKLPLKRSVIDRDKWQVHYEGKKAETSWRVLKRFHFADTEHWKNALSYLRLNLKTGRTHQIRVHLSFLGWPIFADDKYLNKSLAQKDRQFLSHHFLHAERISFTSFSGVKVEVVAPLPIDCESLLKGMVSD